MALVRTHQRQDSGRGVRALPGGPWRPTLFGSPTDDDVYPLGLKVAANGTAMVIWLVVGSQGSTYYSAVRPPGGAWGAPQVVLADPEVSYLQFALSDSGAAIADLDGLVAGRDVGVDPARRRGTWGAPEKVVDTARDLGVAMSAAGDAIVLLRDSYPGVIRSSSPARRRDLGRDPGGAQERLPRHTQEPTDGRI